MHKDSSLRLSIIHKKAIFRGVIYKNITFAIDKSGKRMYSLHKGLLKRFSTVYVICQYPIDKYLI